MEGWTAGGGAWQCVVGGHGEGLRRGGPSRRRLPAGAPAVGGPAFGGGSGPRVGLAWASLAGLNWPTRGLARGAGQLGNCP